MNIDSINNGYVIDHINKGGAMKLYELLHLDGVDASVAMIMNAQSKKMGKKDIIKIDALVPLDFDVIGYVCPDATVNIIKNGELSEKKFLDLPETLTNVLKCKNPRCISSCEQELDHIFRLTDKKTKTYRCIYCETKAN